MELFPFSGKFQFSRYIVLQIIFYGSYDFIPESTDRGKLDSINAGQFLSQLILSQHFTHPIREIIRRLRRQVLVLLQEPMCMMVNTCPLYMFHYAQ
jgi:hypothetical protein